MKEIRKKDLQTVEAILTIIFFKNGDMVIDEDTVTILREHKEQIMALMEE